MEIIISRLEKRAKSSESRRIKNEKRKRGRRKEIEVKIEVNIIPNINSSVLNKVTEITFNPDPISEKIKDLWWFFNNTKNLNPMYSKKCLLINTSSRSFRLRLKSI